MTVTNSIHYAAQIDISDITSDTNAAIGLYAGVFRWITDRPEYDGVTVVPTDYDSDPSFGTIWREKILTDRNDLGDAVRIINILSGGNYGTLSGFKLTADNTAVNDTGVGDALSDYLFDNDYFPISRKVNFYVVIDNVFYSCWSGIVTKIEHNELKIIFTCEDDSKTIHKPFPPKTLTKRIFPNLAKSEGKSIPVCFGLVNNARLLNVQTQNDAVDLMSYSSENYKTAPISAYTESTKTITVLTGNLSFQANVLTDYFVKHILDGNNQVLKIISNTVSSVSATADGNEFDIVLEAKLSGTPVLYPSASDVQGSFVEIFNFNSIYIPSTGEISEYFQSNENSLTLLKYWETGSEKWSDVSEIIEESDLTTLEGFGLIGVDYPGVRVLSKVLDFNGNYSKLTTFIPKTAKIDLDIDGFSVSTSDFINGGDNEYLRNRSKASSQQISVVRTGNDLLEVSFIVEAPDNLLNSDYEKVYILVDLNFETDQSVNLHAPATIECFPRDVFSLEKDGEGQGIIMPVKQLTADIPEEIRLIPGTHYNDGKGKTDLFNDIKTDLDISSFFPDSKVFRSYPLIKFNIALNIDVNLGHTTLVDFYEIALAIEKTVNVVSEDLYAKVNGELYSTSPDVKTDNIYYTIKHILENYDGISTDDIDYGNLLSARSNWTSGRQVTERKSSKEYLQEIAKQCFIGIFPTRTGKRGFKAFRDDTTFSSVVHATDNGSIIAGSISKFEKSDINQVYNDFEIKYDYNPASKEFEQSIYIHNADAGNFPDKLASVGSPDTTYATPDPQRAWSVLICNLRDDGVWVAVIGLADTSEFELDGYISFEDPAGIGNFYFGKIYYIDTDTTIYATFDNLMGIADGASTGTGDLYDHYSGQQAWKEYAGGFTDYKKGSSRWLTCHHGYERTGRLNPLPDSLAHCKWFVEVSKFYPNSPGDNSTAHLYLDELIEWTTRQKDIAEYEIPTTPTNIILEMLTPIKFRDQKETGGNDRQGYITKIKAIPSRNTIGIQAALEPADIDSVTDCIIQETGLSSDTIQETGSAADDIQETGLC